MIINQNWSGYIYKIDFNNKIFYAILRDLICDDDIEEEITINFSEIENKDDIEIGAVFELKFQTTMEVIF